MWQSGGSDVDLYVATDLSTMTEISPGYTTARGHSASLAGNARLAGNPSVGLKLSKLEAQHTGKSQYVRGLTNTEDACKAAYTDARVRVLEREWPAVYRSCTKV